MIHENSRKAFDEQEKAGSIETWRRLVFGCFEGTAAKFTDREIMDVLGTEQDNLVRPEISRLLSEGLLESSGKTKCWKTGKTVRSSCWSGKPYEPRPKRRRRY